MSVYVRHVSGVCTHTDRWRHAMWIREVFACECRECLSAPRTDSWTIHPALIEFAHTLGRSGGGGKTKTQETEKENTLHTIICFPVSPPDTGEDWGRILARDHVEFRKVVLPVSRARTDGRGRAVRVFISCHGEAPEGLWYRRMEGRILWIDAWRMKEWMMERHYIISVTVGREDGQ